MAKKQAKRQESRRIRLQRRLWKTNVAICVVLFFLLAIFWLAVEFRLFPGPDARTNETLEIAEACAIAIFALELYSHYRKAPDKRRFLAQNWLAIIAILPIGIFIRATRAFGGAGAIRPLAARLRLAEADFLLPAVAVSSRPLLALQRWLASIQVFRDFALLLRAWMKKAFR